MFFKIIHEGAKTVKNDETLFQYKHKQIHFQTVRNEPCDHPWAPHKTGSLC